MTLKSQALLSTLLLLTTMFAAAPAIPKEGPERPAVESLLTTNVDGDVFIEPDGSVSEYRLETPVTASLGEMVGRTVRKWRFEPVLVDGQPRRAMARMRLSLVAIPAGKDYQVRVDNVVFPRSTETGGQAAGIGAVAIDIESRRTVPPSYPKAMMRAGLSGRVLLALRAGPDGSAVEVVALQTMLFDARGRERVLTQAMHEFERASVAAARGWRFKLKTRDGETLPASDMTALTTIDFLVGERPAEATGKWRYVSRTAKQPIPWLDQAKTQNPGVTDVQAGEAFPVASAFKLKDAVVGTLLL